MILRSLFIIRTFYILTTANEIAGVSYNIDINRYNLLTYLLGVVPGTTDQI